MAAVLKCDLCSAICEFHKSKRVRIHRVNPDGSRGGYFHEVDICPDCTQRLYNFLEIKENKNESNN